MHSFLRLRIFFVSMLVFIPLQGLATEQSLPKWINKVIVEKKDSIAACVKTAELAYEEIEKAGVHLFGWPGPIFFQTEGVCEAGILLAADEKVDPNVLKEAFLKNGFSVVAIVNNYDGSYLGFSAYQRLSDGSTGICERKNIKQSFFSSFDEGFSVLNSQLSKLESASKEEKMSWIAENFSCENIDNAKSVSIVFDFTSSDFCPYNIKNRKTCFILQGLKEYKFEK